MRRTKITRRRFAGRDHAVLTVTGGDSIYRREPCEQCPWRKDQTGSFPAEAFVLSAPTSYDMAMHTFACHMSGTEKPATCAGFLLMNADNNLMVRLKVSDGKIDFSEIADGGHELHEGYRAMAVANGVDPDDEALALCRDNGRTR